MDSGIRVSEIGMIGMFLVALCVLFVIANIDMHLIIQSFLNESLKKLVFYFHI